MNILDLKKWIIFLNMYSGFCLPTSKMVAEKCFKLISIHSVGPFKSILGVLHPYRGLWRTPKQYFGVLLEFWIIFIKFFWISPRILEWFFRATTAPRMTLLFLILTLNYLKTLEAGRRVVCIFLKILKELDVSFSSLLYSAHL